MSRNYLLTICIAVLLPLSGCASTHVQGDLFESWTATPLWGLIGIAGLLLWIFGILCLLGKWRPRNSKPIGLGLVMVFAGSCLVYMGLTVMPFERLVVTPSIFRSEKGFLGRRQLEVSLDDVERIVVYRAKFPRNNPRYSVGRSNRTIVQFDLVDGESVHVRLGRSRSPDALKHVMKMASDVGIELQDERDN